MTGARQPVISQPSFCYWNSCQTHPSRQTAGCCFTRTLLRKYETQQRSGEITWNGSGCRSVRRHAHNDASIKRFLLPPLCSRNLGYRGPRRQRNSAASKKVPKAVSHSWMFLINILFVWFEIDLARSRLDAGKQTRNWSTCTVCCWYAPYVVAVLGLCGTTGVRLEGGG